FDNSSVGMNYHYIKKLGYTPSSSEGMIQIFENDGHFIDNLMKNVKNIRVYNIAPKINRIAVLLGSGGSFIEEVKALDCDVFISSEFKHHEILYAKEHGIMLVDVTHQAEGVFANVIAEFLSEYKDLEIGVYKDTYEVDILGR
ncbi:MAG: Nif3-like dinuclear metal center hexameric protein, partial [Erysipelotrichales bacterium]